jgi:hypothetical protein
LTQPLTMRMQQSCTGEHLLFQALFESHQLIVQCIIRPCHSGRRPSILEQTGREGGSSQLRQLLYGGL